MFDCKALLLDISGVLYDATGLISGAKQTVEKARQRGLCLRLVTNTASKSARQIRNDLASLGIDIAPEELFTAPCAARQYIENHQLRPFVLLSGPVVAEFDQLEQEQPNCVLLGDARDDLNYQNLNKAFRLCIEGAPLIAVGMNRYFQGENGLQLDAGGFVKAIEWAAGCTALVMGKPSQDFFQQVVQSTGYDANECIMVGDDVQSDVIGALESGLHACLVQTGKYQSGDENLMRDYAKVHGKAMLIPSIASLFD